MDQLQMFLENRSDLLHGNGVSESTICEAESRLGLAFANDYKTYLLKYGILAVNGHEITGLCANDRVNVVEVTEKHRNSNISREYYVIEELNIDGSVVWQSGNGEILLQVGENACSFLNKSLVEYLET